MKKMLKRIISGVLAVVMILSAFPANVSADEGSDLYGDAIERVYLYGDANEDGKVDLLDVRAIKYYMEGETPAVFSFTNADVNLDSVVDMKDLQMIKKYLAEWDIKLGTELLTVNFYDGERLIDSMSIEYGSPLGKVPSVGKSSRADSILLGYYLDENFTEPFYADIPVVQDMDVYAQYQEYQETNFQERLNITSFARMDQSPDLFFEICRVSGNISPADAAVLIIKDGSDPVELSITDSDNDGVYTVSAIGGFLKGSSYELTLAEGWVFKDKETTIRTASFSIAMEEVQNLQMNDDIVYIQDTEFINYEVDGAVYEELNSERITENGGSFEYENSGELNIDDILCIYVGKNPLDRNPKNGAELLDPAVYVKVASVDGSKITFAPLGAEEQVMLFNIPDNFPIMVDVLEDTDAGTVSIDRLDREMYALMLGEMGTYESALDKIEVGDFITLYTSKEEALQAEDNVYYAVITGYDSETGGITYEKTTKQAIIDSMDLYTGIHISGSDILTEEEKQQIEEVLLTQIQESDFAEEAAYILSDMVTKTNGFRENMNVKEFLLSDENGNPLSDEEIRLLNIGSSFELSRDIDISVKLITEGDQLHFGDGIQLAIKINAGFEVEAAEGSVAIDLSATFVEEVSLHPSVRGSMVKDNLLGVFPIGVKVDAAIDIKNYTGISFEAEIYTIAEEEKNTWQKLQSIYEDPTSILGMAGIPEGMREGLKTVGDVMEEIRELEAKVGKATDSVEQLQEYVNTLDTLWDVVEQTGVITEKDWEQMGERLGKTNIASELLGMLDSTADTEISVEYMESMQELMDKYSETIQRETDWIQLVNQEIASAEINYFGLVIGVQTNFIVRADMSIAIGSNLEYEVGKRYNFWFKLGLFTPTAGSSTQDLLDEKFAFQFYVMGKLGLKTGVRAKLYAGIGSGKFASVGITAELGPYIKLWGFFVYEYTKFRPSGIRSWTSGERMAGALYLEFGLYFMLGFEASALGNLFECSYDFLDLEVPLLDAGEKRYYYGNAYEPQEGERVIVRDEDGNSSNGITMVIPESVIALSYVDLNTGIQGSEALDYSRYHFTVSNPNFKIDPKTGVISVTVPKNTRYMQCDLTVTYLYGKLAFSQYDMSVTVPLVWTNLSTEELNEYYTASVRVGNDEDGYQTVWSKRVLKNQEYDLPSDEEIKELIGWNSAKYAGGTGYGAQKTAGLTLIQDVVYDYNVEYKTYSITVNGIQNADGTTRDGAVYTAKYGERFDFSDLAESGTQIEGATYTKFARVTTDAAVVTGGMTQAIDLKQEITGKAAQALGAGIVANAEYVDDSVLALFKFSNLYMVADVEQRLRKGTIPSLDKVREVVENNAPDMMIVDISPLFGRINSSMLYRVTCDGQDAGTAKETIVFHENGGSEIPDMTRCVGEFLGVLPEPVREGYSFEGWYTDNDTFGQLYEEQRMVIGGAELYAKWTANEYQVTFNVNGGNTLDSSETAKYVTYDSAYGTLPVPTRAHYAFTGWYTQKTGGTLITEDTGIAITGAQTLYAQWRMLKDIPETVFDFGEPEKATYEKGVSRKVLYTFDAGGENFTENDFTFKYMRQGNYEYEQGLPVNAGTYNVTVSRPGDDYYEKFEYTYTAVITIDKAVRTIQSVNLEAEERGYTFLKLRLIGDGGIDDLSSEASMTYIVNMVKNGIYDLSPDTSYAVKVKITGDPNYYDATSKVPTYISTLSAPTDKWTDSGNYDTGWYSSTETVFYISSARQLAGVQALLSSGVSFSGKTIKLTADIDLRGHEWYSNGWGTAFAGTFDGQNHKITGLYFDEETLGRVALFGSADSATIKNVLLDHSYIRGNERVAGFVGYATGSTVINNCVNFAKIYATGGDYNAGGILGQSASNGVLVVNCVNYGSVIASGEETGGIVGFVHGGRVCNNANFGYVTGKQDVGGIVGQNDTKKSYVYNNFNVGTVVGTTKTFIGAIVGRNTDNDGEVDQAYYLENCATGGGDHRRAVGTSESSLKDDAKGNKAAYFTSSTSALSRQCEDGVNQNEGLCAALNHWAKRCVGDVGSVQWETNGPGGYPLPVNSPIPEALTDRINP